MIYKIEHNFKEEMIVPMVAIHSNVSFLNTPKGALVITEDSVNCKVVSQEQIHVLDDKSLSKIRELYGADPYLFLDKWYRKYGNKMQSMVFIYIKLAKY